MVYNNIKRRNIFLKRDINRHKNIKVKTLKIRSSITFLIRCRNYGIIPDFIKNSMKNVYNILENIKEREYDLQKTLLTYIEHFQNNL